MDPFKTSVVITTLALLPLLFTFYPRIGPWAHPYFAISNISNSLFAYAFGLYFIHSSLAKPVLPSKRRSAGSANPDENRLDVEIILSNRKMSTYRNPTLSYDSALS